MRRALIPLLLLALAAAGCGKKGPPRPPLPPYPADAAAPRARQAGATVEVLVGVPARRLDGEPIDRLRGLRIFRQAGAAPEGAVLPAPSVLPGDELSVAGALSEEELAALPPGGTYLFAEPLERALGPGAAAGRHRLVYSVRYLVQGNRWSPHTPAAVLFTGPPPPPPTDLRVAAVNAGIELTWQPPSPDLPVAVYRRPAGGEFPFRPLTVVAAGGARWLDPTVALGMRYEYALRSQALAPDQDRLSAAAGPLAVTMEDRFAPLPPRDLQALERPSGVDLFWRAGREIDLGGYRVWRRQLPDGDWVVLTPEPLPGTSFSDGTARGDLTYEYAVTAVDNHEPPNESERGGAVTAGALAPPQRPRPEEP